MATAVRGDILDARLRPTSKRYDTLVAGSGHQIFPEDYEAPETAVVDPVLWQLYDDVADRAFGPWQSTKEVAIRLNQGPDTTVFELHRQEHGGLNGLISPGWPVAVTQGQRTIIG